MVNMISYEEFEQIVVKILERDIASNQDQKSAIQADLNQSLFIVAGPGSGKTTVIVLKILKYLFVDDVEPEEIVATTFTRKAADELTSRILDWGYKIKDYLLNEGMNKGYEFEKIQKIAHIDFNQILTGTVDSVAQDLLRVNRQPGTNLPNVIESFVTESAMTNVGLYRNDRYLNEDLQKYLGELKGRDKIKNPSMMSQMILSIKNKMYYDVVDMDEIRQTSTDPGQIQVLDAIDEYEKELRGRNSIDFPMLEDLFLEKLENEEFEDFLSKVKIVLVDEYQDTNLLQEKIYFKIAEFAIRNGGNITVVGDDDQSLYRFRGATVDLFTNFPKRASESLGIYVNVINLKENYRSTENIINLCNHFAELDEKYQNARVSHKPPIVCPENNKGKNIPIIGLFRNTQEILARDLSNLISELINKGTVRRKVQNIVDTKSFEKLNNSNNLALKSKDKEDKYIEISLDSEDGSASDIAFLTYSTKETSRGHNYKFPYYLRKTLEKRNVEVFNPRGQDIQDIQAVQIFCGLMLECIDPDMKIQKMDKNIPKSSFRIMRRWRENARKFMDKDPEPVIPITLKEFVELWQLRKPYKMDKWPSSVRLMDLAYKLLTWIDYLQEDVEGIVYLEAITQTINQTGFFNEYGSEIYFDTESKEIKSINELYWNVFIPIASGGVSIEEELLETLPDNRLNIMSIHQSKGLEFPLVIVDVGSEFDKDLANTSFLRFPKKGGQDQELEDRIRKYSKDMKIVKRDQVDRSFDDLTRRYFVAFSRAQDVLILVGLTSNIYGYDTKDKHRNIPNIALGWNRDEEFIGFNEMYMI